MTIERQPSTAPAIALGDVAAATGGRLVGPHDVLVRGASVDSRAVVAGSLFVALRGERVDGHAFIADAARAGAAAALVERAVADAPSLPQVVVADTLRSLGDLAAWWRSRHTVRVVGVTGSTGKTLAKEVVADVLARDIRTLRSEGNLNSVIGLPMTLLHLDESHRAAVLEMGMYTTGEIARMAEIAAPEVGVVLAVHATHLERAGSIERIADAKAELPRALPASGLAVLNADDPRVAAMADMTPASVLTFGLGAGADVRAEDVASRGLAGTEFTLRAPWAARRVRSGTPGLHLVPHALAAAAVGEWLDVPFDDVAAALEAGSRAPHRMAISTGPMGTTIVDDTYNASPVSVTAALAFLAETPLDGGGRRIAVLGDMLELGPDEERLHRDTGRVAADAADIVIAVGPRGGWIAEGAESAGAARVVRATDADEAAALLQHQVAPAATDVVLVKGSRGIGLDRTVDLLIGDGS